jgi:hypothetical protein
MLHELFLFIGGPICYGSCLAAVGIGGFVGGIAVLPASNVLPIYTHVFQVYEFSI